MNGNGTNHQTTWRRLIESDSRNTLRMVMWQVVKKLSYTTHMSFSVSSPRVERIPLNQVTARAGGDPESETVGIYLKMHEGLIGHAILMLSPDKALHLVDAMLGEPPGTSTELDMLGRSALAEIGNLMVSFFLNAVAEIAGDKSLLRPSPPAVEVDMLGAILPAVIVPLAAMRDDLLFIETIFKDERGSEQARFWLLPDTADQDSSSTM